ncbi:MAG TPA: ABC transporter ATP-binding protein [Gammaproteobacteria bacterium]|nr:ABC transporter ATP-binding protein [Gammaproteobacteria bacterium]
MDPLLAIDDLHVEFAIHNSKLQALRGVSFDIPPGQTVALVGESGSGKSVTAQAIMGLLPDNAHITGGQIQFANNNQKILDIAALPQDSRAMQDIRGGQISMIFQEPMVSLSPVHTIGDQVSEALFLHREIAHQQGLQLTRDMLDMVGFPDPDRAMKTYSFELSGGMRQRAMLAMALVCRPALLIADEPTTALDVSIQAQILMLLKKLQAELNMAVLLITHDLGVVANLADEVVVMYQGQILERGTLKALFTTPSHPYLKALFAAVPRLDIGPEQRLQSVHPIDYDIHALKQDHDPRSEAQNSLPHLQVTGLYKTFYAHQQGWFRRAAKANPAVIDVSFKIARGESFGLVGESGCGKTTLSKMLMRALKPDQGSVLYNDHGQQRDIYALDNRELLRLRRCMQLIFQDPFSSLNPRMTVFDLIREPLVIHKIGDKAYHAEMAKSLMHMVGLDPRYLRRYPHSFSGGQRQRIGIARALALKPELIICDEPVSALDVSIQAQILNLLKDLQQELGLSYLFISHNLAVIHYVAQRIAVMCQGQLVEIASREQLFAKPLHPYTQALLSAVPIPDLTQPLDFHRIMDGRASKPQSWPAPYTVNPGQKTMLQEVEPQHWVRQVSDSVPQRAQA